MAKRGYLVSFEGGEACGKSTQIKLFEQFLKDDKIDYLLLREPGGTETGEKLRQILQHDNVNLSSKAELLLLSASRCILVEEKILPALKSGKVVILDRYYDSTYAYQGYAGNLKLSDINFITQFVVGKAKPDLTILLDQDITVGLKRKSADKNLQNLDRFEQKSIEYHNKVRLGYQSLAKKEKHRFVIIDATKSVEEISKIIRETFLQRYNAR